MITFPLLVSFVSVIIFVLLCLLALIVVTFVSTAHILKLFNLLKPNDIYICRTAALTSRRYILYIYSTNIHTEYFKHAA